MMDRSKTTRRRKKRRGTRRLRYDRVFLVLILPVVAAIGLAMAITQCDGTENDGTEITPATTDTPEPTVPATAQVSVPEPTPAVKTTATVTPSEAGRRDAARVAEGAPGSMQRQEALLAIHARVSAIRAKGYIHAADEYMEAVRAYLRSHTDIQI